MTMANDVFLLIMLIWVVIAPFVALDADKRNRSPIIWFIITLVTGVIGLILYLISITPNDNGKKDEQTTMTNKDPSTENTTNNGEVPSKPENVPEVSYEDFDYTLEDDSPQGELLAQEELLVSVTDGINEAKFIKETNEIREFSSVYRRKFGDEWVNKAISFLEREVLEIGEKQESTEQEKQDFEYTLEEDTPQDEPLMRVTDGVNEAKFIKETNEIRELFPSFYRREFGDEWVNKAISFLEHEILDKEEKRESTEPGERESTERNTLEELERLADLRARGAISEEEFEELKRDVMKDG